MTFRKLGMFLSIWFWYLKIKRTYPLKDGLTLGSGSRNHETLNLNYSNNFNYSHREGLYNEN
jgi:hypothetical protein